MVIKLIHLKLFSFFFAKKKTMDTRLENLFYTKQFACSSAKLNSQIVFIFFNIYLG